MDPKNQISVKDLKYLKNTLKDLENRDPKDPKVAEYLSDLKD